MWTCALTRLFGSLTASSIWLWVACSDVSACWYDDSDALHLQSDRGQRKAFGSLFKQGGEGLGIDDEPKQKKADGEPRISADIVRGDADQFTSDICGMVREGGKQGEGEGGQRVEVKAVKKFSLEKDIAPT